jgi:hypothetical protein
VVHGKCKGTHQGEHIGFGQINQLQRNKAMEGEDEKKNIGSK